MAIVLNLDYLLCAAHLLYACFNDAVKDDVVKANVVTADSYVITADAEVEDFRHDRLHQWFIAEIYTRRENIWRQRSQRRQLQLTDDKIVH